MQNRTVMPKGTTVFIRRVGTDNIQRQIDVSGLSREDAIVRIRWARAEFETAHYWIDDRQIQEHDEHWYCAY